MRWGWVVIAMVPVLRRAVEVACANLIDPGRGSPSRPVGHRLGVDGACAERNCCGNTDHGFSHLSPHPRQTIPVFAFARCQKAFRSPSLPPAAKYSLPKRTAV